MLILHQTKFTLPLDGAAVIPTDGIATEFVPDMTTDASENPVLMNAFEAIFNLVDNGQETRLPFIPSQVCGNIEYLEQHSHM